MSTKNKHNRTNQISSKYEEVTNNIIRALEEGTRPWVCPWNGGILQSPVRFNKEPYQGINTLILWDIASKNNYNSPYWMTFKQASSLGGKILKGQKATTIFFSGSTKIEIDENLTNSGNKKQEESEKEESEDLYRKFMKAYKVFNANQIENLPEEYYEIKQQRNLNDSLERSPDLEKFVKKTCANIKEGGIKAYYSGIGDYIQIPELQSFKSSNSYYATLLHELIHWTKHRGRLNRYLGSKNFGFPRFGSSSYAMEELVAELGSAFLSSCFGIVPDIREDHAPYIASWLKVLKSDKKAIFSAATLAQAACNYLHDLVNEVEKYKAA